MTIGEVSHPAEYTISPGFTRSLRMGLDVSIVLGSSLSTLVEICSAFLFCVCIGDGVGSFSLDTSQKLKYAPRTKVRKKVVLTNFVLARSISHLRRQVFGEGLVASFADGVISAAIIDFVVIKGGAPVFERSCYLLASSPSMYNMIACMRAAFLKL